MQASIVFVTGHGDIAITVQTIKAGAEDFLTKPVLKEKLLEVIGRALIRHEQMREQDTRIAALRSLLSRLTPREHEVFTLLVRGKPTSRSLMRGHIGTNRQNASTQCDAKISSPISCGACSGRGTSWITVGRPPPRT